MNVVNTVIDPYAYHYRGNRNGHDVEGYTRKPHNAQHQARGENIGRQRQQRERQ